MKNLITKSLLVLAIVCLGFAANAQNFATLNSTHELEVTPDANMKFTWTAVHAVSSTVITSTDGFPNDHTVTLLWPETGVWNITVTGEDLTTNCFTEPMTTTVTVVGGASVMFVDNSPALNDIITCSLLFGDTPISTDFDVVFTGGLAPFVLKYIITDKDGNDSALLTKIIGADGDLSPVTGNISLSDFENTTLANLETTIRIVSAKTADDADVTLSATASDLIRKITVRTKPVITGPITFN
jgi:hypothetical protein